MLRDFSISALFMGLLVAFVGFASSFAVVLEGLRAAGANEAEAVSGLMALSIAMGVAGLLLSLWSRAPVSCAWSTPGAALLIGSGPLAGGFAEAVGGFLLCGGLLTLAGLWRPLGRAVTAIPAPLANAMIAGILLVICLVPFQAVTQAPQFALPMLLAWAFGGLLHRYAAVPCALLAVLVCLVAFGAEGGGSLPDPVQAGFAPVVPVVTMQAALGIALPLFIVTMASQNVPGLAILQQAGYPVAPRRWLTTTGLLSAASAPLGGHAVNLAALTAAMCVSEDAHGDPARRYWSAAVAGAAYVAMGFLAGEVTALFALAPAAIVPAIAGLALIPAFSSAVVAAFESVEARMPAAVTFLTAASGMQVFGIGGAFWGLIAGGTVFWLTRLRNGGLP